MEHIFNEFFLNDKNAEPDIDSKNDNSKMLGIRRLRKLTPEEEEARNKRIALNNEIYGTGKVSDRIFSNIEKYKHEEYQYLNLIQNILENGTWENGRNGKVKSLFGASMRFSLKDGHIPILTTKKVAWKTCLKELLWFIKGDTNNKHLQEQGVHIWDTNASKEFMASRNLTHYEEGLLGPIYGWQWRRFNAPYNYSSGEQEQEEFNIREKGFDQLQYIIDQLKNPETRNNRRLVMSAWNPTQLSQMALPPCHVMCQFNVHDGNKLSCMMVQRSSDCMLGQPFNIASYSFLTHLIAKHCDLEPYEFIHFLGNCHIYEDHISAAETQIKRIPYKFPSVEITTKRENIDDYTISDFVIKDYISHESIKMKMVA